MYRYPHLLQYRYDGMPKLEHRSGRMGCGDTPSVEGDEHGNVWHANFGPAKLEEATIFKASRTRRTVRIGFTWWCTHKHAQGVWNYLRRTETRRKNNPRDKFISRSCVPPRLDGRGIGVENVEYVYVTESARAHSYYSTSCRGKPKAGNSEIHISLEFKQ